MSEQLSDIEDENSESTDIQSRRRQRQEEEFWSWKTMSQYARESICLLAFFLTTYATFQNRGQKFSRPPPPTYLFGKNSLVQEYTDGQLGVIQTHVATSELSLVFFYAPWCAESRFAKNIIEELAKQFSEEVYFAAVNCWQPGGECKMQHPRVDSWPILMAYYPKGLAVQYNDVWNLKSISSFIDKLFNPIRRIENEKDFLRAKLNNRAVVIGFFQSTQPSEHYQIFFQMAVKSLEHVQLRGIEFAIVVGNTIKQFNLTTTLPAIRIHSLNSTAVYGEKLWSTDSIHNWIKRNFDTKNIWIEISGRKSWNLSQYLKKKPALVAFYPRHYLGNNNDAYYMLRQVAFGYNDCALNESSSETTINFIKSLREENKKQKTELKLKCLELIKKKEKIENFLPSQNCNVTELLWSNIENAKNINMHDYCPCNQNLYTNKISTQYNYKENVNDDGKKEKFTKNTFSMDTKDPKYLLEKSLEYKCWKLSFVESYSNYSMNHEINTNFIGLGCKYNRTLSFVMADSDLYSYMMKSLGVNLHIKNLSKALVFIVDKEQESTFQMKDAVSVSSLINFIENFHNNSLTRNLRKKLLLKKNDDNHKSESLSEERFYIKEINSRQFKEIIKNPKKNTIILFYSSQCALCNILSRTLLSIGKVLKASNINIFRIDGENNDFSWEYTMDSFPTLLSVPKGREIDARIYPKHIQVSSKNLLRFILATLSRTDRLKLIIEICRSFQAEYLMPTCLKNFRIEVTNCISDNLNYLRQNNNDLKQNSFSKTLTKLEILQTVYYLTFKLRNSNLLKIITDNIVILNNV